MAGVCAQNSCLVLLLACEIWLDRTAGCAEQGVKWPEDDRLRDVPVQAGYWNFHHVTIGEACLWPETERLLV